MTIGFVYVVESPADVDLLDGRTEGRSLCEALQLAEIRHQYSLVTTERTLQDSLGTRLDDALKRFDQPPILHLSMHGNNDGVALTDGFRLIWEDLRRLLTPLTDRMRGGLLICMSSCFGISGCRMAMHEEESQPFWALVGNTQAAAWSDAAVGYISFYHNFFKGIPVETCVDRMKVASGDDNFEFLLGHAVKSNWIGLMESTRRGWQAQSSL